jgi:hypothetical protein
VNEILMRIVLESAAFIELVSDDVLDADTALKQLESIAFLLQQLNSDEPREF